MMSGIGEDLLNMIDRLAVDSAEKTIRDAAEEGAWPAALWDSLEHVGLTAATVPETHGGPGIEFDDAMIALQRAAFHALPGPLAETMLAARLLAAAGLQPPTGPLTVALGEIDTPLRLHKRNGSLVLDGAAARVPWACHAGHLVAPAVGDDGVSMIALLDARALTVEGMEKNLAGEPRTQVSFRSHPVLASAALDNARDRALADGALFRTVQIAGALQRSLESSIQYANERLAFGRPIGKFQAVQQMLAVLAGHAAAASAAARFAVSASASAPNVLAIAVAKARTSEAAGRGAEIAHQIHGAMGFTREHALHYATRRLWSWRDEFGNETYWQIRLGHAAASKGWAEFWQFIVGIGSDQELLRGT